MTQPGVQYRYSNSSATELSHTGLLFDVACEQSLVYLGAAYMSVFSSCSGLVSSSRNVGDMYNV